MSRIRYQSKSNGLTLLNGKWLKAGVILLLTSLIFFGVTAIEAAFRSAARVPMMLSSGAPNLSAASWLTAGVFSVVMLLFVPPIFTGQSQWYWSLSGKKSMEIGEVFNWFGSLRLYLKSVAVAADVFMRCLGWGALCCGVPAALIWAAYNYFPDGAAAFGSPKSFWATPDDMLFMMLLVIGTALLIGGILLMCYIVMRYFLVVFLLAEDSTRPVRAIVRESVSFTKGQRWEILKFCLSFILWFMTLYFIIPAFFVLPYFNSASAIFAKHLIYAQRAKARAVAAGGVPAAPGGNTPGSPEK